MSVVKVVSTKNVSNNLKYLFDERAHNEALTTHRNEMAMYRNVKLNDWNNDFNLRYVICQFLACLQRAKNSHKKTQAQHLIFSFSQSEFPMNKSHLKQNTQQLSKLMAGFVKEYFPSNMQSVCVVQADSKGENLHAHMVINSVLTNGKVFNTNLVSVNKVREAFDHYCERNFEKITNRPYTAIQQDISNIRSANLAHTNKYIWTDDLKDRIRRAENVSGSMDEFINKLGENGVTVNIRRSSTGEKRDGKKVYRQAFTYEFSDLEGSKQKIRDFYYRKGQPRGLGTAFIPDEIEKVITKHKSKQVDDATVLPSVDEADKLLNALNAEIAETEVVKPSLTVNNDDEQEKQRIYQQKRRNRENQENKPDIKKLHIRGQRIDLNSVDRINVNQITKDAKNAIASRSKQDGVDLEL